MDFALPFDVSIETTIGALEIGILVSYAFFRVTTTQTYIYYSRFLHNPKKTKALVAFVWVCETAHALCLGHALYVYTISNFAHPERLLGAPPKSLATTIFLTGIVEACVQGFFSFRIYALSKPLYIPILTWGMAFLRLPLCAAILVECLGFTTLLDITDAKWQWLLTATWSISAANNLTVTAALVVLCRQSRNVHKRTTALVDKLILWTIETGMLTSAAAIVMLVCYVTMKDNFIWAGVFSVVPRRDLFEHPSRKSELQGDAPRIERGSVVVSDAIFDTGEWVTTYMLFGVTTTQTYIYYSRFPDDSPKLKALVAFVWVCEMAHALCVGHTLYVYTISDYAHPERLVGPAPVSLEAGVIFSGVIGACVQGFFSFRIYAFSKKLHVCILLWIMVLWRLLGEIVIFVTALGSVSAGNDLAIAASLVVLLYGQRTNAHKRTGALLDKLIAWTIETGVATSAWDIITLACFVLMKENFIWLPITAFKALLDLPSGKVPIQSWADHICLVTYIISV
ncbi:hypothetical protein B0H13DRAFT_2400677 [Mycena leptocephala]|nr:hypothetical protein B0H13DRAFT_2400677 [Mycena leptocephala]